MEKRIKIAKGAEKVEYLPGFTEASVLSAFNDKVEFICYLLPNSDKSINFALKITGVYGNKGRS